jgi:hypothetical protein
VHDTQAGYVRRPQLGEFTGGVIVEAVVRCLSGRDVAVGETCQPGVRQAVRVVRRRLGAAHEPLRENIPPVVTDVDLVNFHCVPAEILNPVAGVMDLKGGDTPAEAIPQDTLLTGADLPVGVHPLTITYLR